MKNIEENGKLKVTLYHGTNSIFMDSILEKGLGYCNPISDLNVKATAAAVFELAKEHISESILYQKNFVSFNKMIKQEVTKSFNYQHGQTYLSPSMETASNYAVSNLYGSEFVSYTLKFIEELIKHDISIVKDLANDNPDLFNLLRLRSSPILIGLDDLPISWLKDERGNSPEHNIKYLQEIQGNSYESLCKQTNFRLTSVVPSDQISIYLINHLAKRNFAYYKLHLLRSVVE